ncbi:Glycosyltransferase involved in cell wall bisynthesis [Microbacterium sp. cf046]|uniref:glycosyltransferase family 4 protein n=1 Tax=Microbacterium sp. cf046 TaxID=1761803 RepID=UPI0008DFE9EE|nr:glycosyltransferase family 4 protein [Microbacterium sp. cf046]SFR95687.1 Glycosyltransferase involved in cell wall bisynthesis [Microbacterium sp. cf046]
MKVLLVTRIFSPEAAAASFRLSALVGELARRAIPVTVLTSTPPARLKVPAAPAGVTVRRARVLRDRTGYLRGYLPYASFDIPAFFRVLFARRSDVVVVEPPPTTGFAVRLASALRRTPYVYYAADIWSDAASSTGAPGIVIAFVRWVERRALRGARAVIAVSAGVADRVLALAPHAQVEVVPNGVDTDVFTAQGPIVEDAAWGVYAGTASEWQGADVFIRAMPSVRRALPDATIAFIGQGSAWAELRALADQVAPGAVRFIDAVPAADAASHLRSARAGLVSLRPGQGYDFAVPTKIFAAAATGTPVLFAGPGPANAVIADAGLGVAVAFDEDAVAHAMVDLFGAPASADDRARRAERVATEFSSEARAADAADAVIDAARAT